MSQTAAGRLSPCLAKDDLVAQNERLASHSQGSCDIDWLVDIMKPEIW